MQRRNLDELEAFLAIAESLSFRGAAAKLGVTPSALSHTIRKLEERVGVRLLNRTTRSVSPTDAGFRLLERLRPAFDQIDGAIAGVNSERETPFGRLRICAGRTASAMVVSPIWEKFLSTYPDVQLELRVDEAPADIVALGFDAGIAARERIAADMVAVRVTAPRRVAIVAAPDYMKSRPVPKVPEDLVHHSCIQYRVAADGGIFVWRFSRNGVERRVATEGRLVVNHPDLTVRAAADGVGVAYALEATAEPFLRSGQLIRLLEDWSPLFEGLFLYYPGHRQVPAALRVFIDVVREGQGWTPGDYLPEDILTVL